LTIGAAFAATAATSPTTRSRIESHRWPLLLAPIILIVRFVSFDSQTLLDYSFDHRSIAVCSQTSNVDALRYDHRSLAQEQSQSVDRPRARFEGLGRMYRSDCGLLLSNCVVSNRTVSIEQCLVVSLVLSCRVHSIFMILSLFASQRPVRDHHPVRQVQFRNSVSNRLYVVACVHVRFPFRCLSTITQQTNQQTNERTPQNAVTKSFARPPSVRTAAEKEAFRRNEVAREIYTSEKK
jgi:hypothetical protein